VVTPGHRGAGRRIVLVTHSYFEEDPRLRRQADVLLADGWHVDVIALRRPGDPKHSEVDGANVRRVGVQRQQGAGVGTYLVEYMQFFFRAAARLIAQQFRRRYDLAQVATLPDWLVFAALPLRVAGTPVLLDLHEAMPDFFATRFPRVANRISIGAMRTAEWLSVRAASHAITVNAALRERLVELGAPDKSVDVVPNAPSLVRFDPSRHAARPFMADGTLRLIYAGALTPTYELDVAIRAMSSLRVRRHDLAIELDVYGRGDSRDHLESLAEQHDLRDAVHFHGRIPIEDVPAAISRADIGLAPTRLDRFTQSSLSTKIFEYGAMGKPAIASRLPLIQRELPPDSVVTYEAGDANSLADMISALVDQPALRRERVDSLRTWVLSHSWEQESSGYLDLVDRLARR
jgi:glycosyltransferase involved in cell wall biosynthesis